MSMMVERVADAIDAVDLISRWNDWTSDHIPGWPIEICDASTGDPVVIERFRAEVGEMQALADVLVLHRARAAIAAMNVVMSPLVAQIGNSADLLGSEGFFRASEHLSDVAAQLEAALKP